MDAEVSDPDRPGVDSASPFIVGIGASAGGLEAIREFVKNLPDDINACYVIVQHMSPDHKSLLRMLIARETSLDVLDVTDGIAVEPNRIYVTPPNADVQLAAGRLKLLPPSPEPGAPKPSVDRLFISLAEDAGEKAVGIVLSGTGADGSYGIRAIRAAGGITIAQDEKTAKYDGMPVAAVETGLVDLVLSPVQIGTHLANILTSSRNFDRFRATENDEHPLADLLQIVLARTRVDFREYKPNTIYRRLERRINALGIAGQEEYTRYCRTNPREVDALFKDLLISVTRFFRDPAEFESLGPVVRRIVEEAGGRTIRVWVAGCATGEEAYSIAMLFAQELGPENVNKDRLQIFATDIDTDALEVARRGTYSIAALDDIPKEFSETYLSRDDEFINVERLIRDVVVFSEHNLCQDPPFINIDLMCCRNLLIYFGQTLQLKVMARLFYALRSDGYMFLGTAENASISADLFRTVAGEAHIFRKRAGASQSALPEPRSDLPTAAVPRSERRQPGESERLLDRAMFDELAAAVGPDALLISDDFRILRVYGDVSRYLRLARGSRLQFDTSVLTPRLAREARTIGAIALRRYERRRGQPHALPGDEDHEVQVEAYPIKAPQAEEAFILLVFRRRSVDTAKRDPVLSSVDEAAAERIETLENDLRTIKEELQLTIEELETSNEELQAANEEMQSTNEELRSSNEELETSNEELQSTNEELVTVNEELQISKSEIHAFSAEQSAILSGIGAPMLIIDMALQIKTANDEAVELFSLRRPVERPHISQLLLPPGFPRLSELCSEAMHLGETRSAEVVSDRGFYVVRCSPFYNEDGQMRGATIFVVRSELATDLAKRLEFLLEQADVYYMHRTRDGTITAISSYAAKAIFGLQPEQAIGKNLSDLVDAEFAESMKDRDAKFLDSDANVEPNTYRMRTRHDGRMRVMQIQRFRFREEGKDETIFVMGTDVTDISHKSEELRELYEMSPSLLMYRSRDGRILQIGRASADVLGKHPDEIIGRPLTDFLSPESAQEILDTDRRFLEGDESVESTYYVVEPPGADEHTLQITRKRVNFGGEEAVLATGIEITARHRTAQAVGLQVVRRVSAMSGVYLWVYDLTQRRRPLTEAVWELAGAEDRGTAATIEAMTGYFHAEDRGRFSSAVQTAIDTGEGFDMAARIVTTDGDTIPVRAICEVEQENGKVGFLVGMVQPSQ